MERFCTPAVAFFRAAAIASAAADQRRRRAGRRIEISPSICRSSSATSAACTSCLSASSSSPPSAAFFCAPGADNFPAAASTRVSAAAVAVTGTSLAALLSPLHSSACSLPYPVSFASTTSRSLGCCDSSFPAFLDGYCGHASRRFSTNRWKKFKRAGSDAVLLPRNSNQALGIAEYALAFLAPLPASSCSEGAGDLEEGKEERVAEEVYEKTQLFHIDSVLCGISALALQTKAPTLLREEALDCSSGTRDRGACVFGSKKRCLTEKVVAANCAAVREWDANGTVFGFNRSREEHRAGEFGHNDFYPVVIAAAQASATKSINGKAALKAMICLDEIRGRLAEVFSLKTYKIDHVVHGAIASAAVYGALMGASAEEIESAIGMVVSHYVPWRALRAGEQLSDSKGASAALSAEAAVLCVRRSMAGFCGPRDIFRNPEALFRWNSKTSGDAPFDLILATAGSDFAVRGMHFKIGLYEHQAAGALEGLLQLLVRHPEVCTQLDKIEKITITAYEPAFGIIGDPAKRNPQTRQSADHSMVYIIATLLRKAAEFMQQPQEHQKHEFASLDDAWCTLMLTPYDYSKNAIFNPTTRALMEKIIFQHGGEEYDQKYPEGIPSRVTIQLFDGSTYDSGFVMFPPGHAGNKTADLKKLLKRKFSMLSSVALAPPEACAFIEKLERLQHLGSADLQTLYYCKNLKKHPPVD